MGLGTEHQPGVLARGMGFAALLALAVIIAISMASGLMDQVRSLGASPSTPQGAPAAASYEP
jgi:hypothetical protein